MALSAYIKNNTMGTITFKDGATVPNEYVVDFEQGDFTLSSIKRNLRETSHYEVKGKYRSSAPTSRVYPEGSFSCAFTEWSEATEGTLIDFLTGHAPYNDIVSVNPGILAFDIEYTVAGNDDEDDATIILENVEVTIDSYSEGDPSTFSISFTVLGDILVGPADSLASEDNGNMFEAA